MKGKMLERQLVVEDWGSVLMNDGQDQCGVSSIVDDSHLARGP